MASARRRSAHHLTRGKRSGAAISAQGGGVDAVLVDLDAAFDEAMGERVAALEAMLAADLYAKREARGREPTNGA